MSVRLIALDLDGTILEQGRVISEGVIEALRTLAAAGIRCTTATGRPSRFQEELFARHELGADGRRAALPHALMGDERELFLLDQDARRYRPHRAWNDLVRARWDALHDAAMAWVKRVREEAAQRGCQTNLPFTPDEMYRRGLPTIAFPTADQAFALQSWLSARLASEEPRLACNRNVRLVQIHDALAGKGYTLAELARHWDVAPGEVLAIGDSANDFSMLDGRLGFRCATPGNGEERIKDAVRAAGGYVARGRIGEGVVEALHHCTGEAGALQLSAPERLTTTRAATPQLRGAVKRPR